MKDWQALSRRQGLTADAPPPRHVVIVSRTGSLRAALRQVECLRQEGRATWLIAHGASLIELPPADAGVLQTELGAFVSPDYLQASKPLRAELRGWLEDFFGPTGKDLCGSAAIRFLQHLIEMSYFLPQLQAMAQGREVFFFDRAGFVAEGLCRPGPAGPTWKLELVGRTLTYLGAASIRLLTQYRRWSKEFAAIRQGRLSQTKPVDFWVMLQRGWYRLNLHLLAGLVLPQLAGGRRVGALLVGEHLDDEVRGERTTATEAGMFPGLGPLRDRAEQLAIEQVVLPDTFGGIAAVLAQAWKISLKSLALMLRRPRVCKFSRGQLDRAELVDAFARLATVDVLRAISARHATRDFLGRYRLREGLVLSSGSELAAEAAADLTLQEAGLSTTEFLHGAGAEEWVSPLQTPSALVATWTEVDARELRALGHQTTCMGMPWEASSPREKPGRPVRVLLATNYVHRDYEIEGEFPYHTFLVDLLRLPERLEGLATGEFKVRWRPHPAEKVEALLDAEQKAQARPDRSVDSLADDLEWADVVVSTMSSLVFQALLAEIPTFVHILPQYRHSDYAQALHPSRWFLSSLEAAEKLLAWSENAEDPEPERFASRSFWGPSGKPAPIALERLRVTGAAMAGS